MTCEEAKREIAQQCETTIQEGLGNGRGYCRFQSCEFWLNLKQGNIAGFYFYSNVNVFDQNASLKVIGPWLQSLVRQSFPNKYNFPGNRRPTNPHNAQEGHIADFYLENFNWENLSEQDIQRIKNLYGKLRKFQDKIWPTTSEELAGQIREYNTNNCSEIQQYLEVRKRTDTIRTNNVDETHGENKKKGTSSMDKEIQSLLEANLNVILTGAPGTGKTYTAKTVAHEMTDDTEKTPDEDSHIASIQFHPGYDYADFVIGMKPKLVGEKGKEQVAFDWEDGIFKKFANKAKRAYDATAEGQEPPKFVFIIDEINRADLSRVFGELFSLLEEEYRYPNRENGITLPNGEEFVIPMNLYIIGTMNDIDRSVESMDFALRRRFAWFEVKAEDTATSILNAKNLYGNPKISDEKAALMQEAMKELNKVIGGEKLTLKDGKGTSQDYDLHLGREYQLGGAIFAKFEKYKDDAEGFKKLWNNHILNILSEYLRGRHDRDALLKGLENVYNKAVGLATDENGAGKQSDEGRANNAGQE